MPKKAPADHPNLFAIAPEEKPSLLSGVGDQTPAKRKAVKNSGVRSPESAANIVSFPQAKEAPVVVDESHWPSRKKIRKGLRLNAQEVLKTEAWLVGRRNIVFQDVVDGLLKAFNAGTFPTIPGLGAQTPERDDLIDQTMIKEDDIDQLSSSTSDPSLVTDERTGDRNSQDAENARLEEIIAFYEVTTGTPHTPKDIQAVRSVFELSDAAINAGILRSVIFCKGEDGGPGRVGSFKYCLKVIRQIAKSRIDPREEFHRMYETFFAKVRGGQLILPREGTAFLEGRFGKNER